MTDTTNYQAGTPFDPARDYDADSFSDLSVGEQRAVHLESLRGEVEKLGAGARYSYVGTASMRSARMDAVEDCVLAEVGELLREHPHEFLAEFVGLCVRLAPLEPETSPMPRHLRIENIRRLRRLIEELTDDAE